MFNINKGIRLGGLKPLVKLRGAMHPPVSVCVLVYIFKKEELSCNKHFSMQFSIFTFCGCLTILTAYYSMDITVLCRAGLPCISKIMSL